MLMNKLKRSDLFSLEVYSDKRSQFRAEVMAHKKNRQVQLGEHATLYFEDRLTIQYQIQEMLRIERIFEAEGIEEELAAYNPLIPDGGNLKATFMIEYADVEERKQALQKLLGIERRIWIKVNNYPVVQAIADEDLDRETEEKTSAVHFLRFEFSDEMVRAAKQGAAIAIGVDHAAYHFEIDKLDEAKRVSLVADFE